MTCPRAHEVPRWRRRPADRPEEILKAALQVFLERGLAGARMEDIAQEAGISKGTLYLYFSGKEELFQEAIRDKVTRLLAGLASAAPPGEPVQRLTRFMEAYWVHLSGPQFANMYRLIMAELQKFPDLVRFWADEVSGRVIGLLAEIIREGVDAGELRAVDPLAASRMIVGILVQHAVWSSRRELFAHLEDRTDETLLAEVENFVLSALLAPGATTKKAVP
ncbi:MAG: TetR/AcrR family transcriptional regulator [Gemmatimonadota bacterium]|jgi:AcrR family transcriptional regulator